MPPHLDFQEIAMPFGQGLAEDVAPSLVPAGKLAVAEQGHIDKQGAVQVRPGFQIHPTEGFRFSPDLTDVTRVLPHGREICAVDGLRFRAKPQEVDAWIDVDYIYEATIHERYRGERGRDAMNVDADVCFCEGWIFYVWSLGGREGLRVRVVDAETQTKTYQWSLPADTPRARLVVTGTNVHLIYVNTAFQIAGATWDTTNIEANPVLTVLGLTPVAPGLFDACSDGDRVYVAYWYDDAGTLKILLLSYTSALVGIASVSWPALVSSAIGIDAFQGGQVYVAWKEQPPPAAGNDIWCAVVDETTMALVGGTMVHTPFVNENIRSIEVVTDDVGNACVVWESYGSNDPLFPSYPQLRARWVTALAMPMQGCQVHRAGLLTRPIFREGRVYVGAYVHGQSHKSYSLIDDDSNRFGYLLELRFDEVTPIEPPDPDPDPEQ